MSQLSRNYSLNFLRELRSECIGKNVVIKDQDLFLFHQNDHCQYYGLESFKDSWAVLRQSKLDCIENIVIISYYDIDTKFKSITITIQRTMRSLG